MGDKTKIEWTDATWNCLRGCTRVSEGCRNCYAEGVAARFNGPGQPYEGLAAFVGAKREPRWTGKVVLVEHLLNQPLRWKKPRRIFVNSMSDLFHESVPNEWIDRVFAVMALAPQHIFQVLTKRPERMRQYLNIWFERLASSAVELPHPAGPRRIIDCFDWATLPTTLPNLWLGVSVEDQATADERIPLLLDTPAAKRFISAEPLLGPVDSRQWLRPDLNCERCKAPDLLAGDCCYFAAPCLNRAAVLDRKCQPLTLDWVIVGGESGPNARPMHPDWARGLRDQCGAAGVPYFFKQWGEWVSVSEVAGIGPHFHFEDGATVRRIGKKAAGAMLDGREWREFPAEDKEKAEA